MRTIEDLYDRALEDLLREEKIATTEAIHDSTRSNPVVLSRLATATNVTTYAETYREQYKLTAHKLSLYRRIYNLFIETHGSPVGDHLAGYLRSLELRLRVQQQTDRDAEVIKRLADRLQSDDTAALVDSLQDLYEIILDNIVHDVLMNLVRDEL